MFCATLRKVEDKAGKDAEGEGGPAGSGEDRSVCTYVKDLQGAAIGVTARREELTLQLEEAQTENAIVPTANQGVKVC